MPIDLWTTHSLDKVFPDSGKPPRASQSISLKAARNETEDAQVALRIPRDVEIAQASFSLPHLIGPDRRRIDQLSARVRLANRQGRQRARRLLEKLRWANREVASSRT